MVLRLVIDAVRRKWHIAAFAVFQLHIMVPILGKIWPSSEGMAWTMAGSLFLSMATADLFTSRELYQLPVSRRTWWRARWWLSVVGSVLVAQLAVSLAQWRAGSRWFGLEQAVLYMIFGVLYCGVSMAVRSTRLGKSADAPGTFASSVVFLPALFLFVAAPIALAPYLPHSFSEIGATWVVVMLAMAIFTVAGYGYEPAIAARPYLRLANRLASIRSVPTVPSETPLAEKPAAGFIARLTGAKMVLWEECRKQFLIFSTAIALGVAWWAVGSLFRPWPGLAQCLRPASLLPFASSRAVFVETFIFSLLIVIANFSDGWMADRIRSLRTLPISSARFSGLPAALGLVSASMLWIVLLVLHALVLGTLPASLRPDLFIAFAAVSATAHTIRFTAPGQRATKGLLAFAPVAVIWLTLAYIADSTQRPAVPALPQPVMLIGGLLTLAASWMVMRVAVSRSSRMYRPQPVAPMA